MNLVIPYLHTVSLFQTIAFEAASINLQIYLTCPDKSLEYAKSVSGGRRKIPQNCCAYKNY